MLSAQQFVQTVYCQMCYCPCCRYIKSIKSLLSATMSSRKMTGSSSLPYYLKDCLLLKMPGLNSLFRILFCHPFVLQSTLYANGMEILPSSPRTEMQGNECQSTLFSICLSIPPGDFHLLTISIILYRQCKCKLQLNPCANSLPLYLIRCDGESWLPAWLAWGIQRKSGKHTSEFSW